MRETSRSAYLRCLSREQRHHEFIDCVMLVGLVRYLESGEVIERTEGFDVFGTELNPLVSSTVAERLRAIEALD